MSILNYVRPQELEISKAGCPALFMKSSKCLDPAWTVPVFVSKNTEWGPWNFPGDDDVLAFISQHAKLAASRLGINPMTHIHIHVLPHWILNPEDEEDQKWLGRQGSCTSARASHRCNIVVTLSRTVCLDDLVDTIIHELLHYVLSGYGHNPAQDHDVICTLGRWIVLQQVSLLHDPNMTMQEVMKYYCDQRDRAEVQNCGQEGCSSSEN